MDFSPLWISLKVAVCATVFTFFLGLLSARLVLSLRAGKALIDGIFSLPMVLPPTVVGFFLLIIFGKNSLLGGLLLKMGISVLFTWQGAVIAAVVVSMLQGRWECRRQRFFSGFSCRRHGPVWRLPRFWHSPGLWGNSVRRSC